jgi:hypothetical protein
MKSCMTPSSFTHHDCCWVNAVLKELLLHAAWQILGEEYIAVLFDETSMTAFFLNTSVL